MRKISLLLLVLLLLPCAVSAITYTNGSFTPIFDLGPLDDQVHYNQTYVVDTTGYTPLPLWLFLASLSITLFVVSYRWNDDMLSLMSILVSFITAWTSRTIDIINGYGVTAQQEVATGNTIVLEWVYMEMHQIYHIEAITLLFAIVFIVSILNSYRIYLLNRKAVFDNESTNFKGRGGSE